jgi:invasion protein IalB
MTRFTALLSSFALMFALSAFAANTQSSKDTTTNTNTAKTTSTTAKNATANHSKAEQAKKPASDVLARAENLSGKISTIGSSGKEVTLMGANGVPYDFDLTGKTKIEVGNQRIASSQLTNETQKQATVHFVPTARGNVAETIQIS